MSQRYKIKYFLDGEEVEKESIDWNQDYTFKMDGLDKCNLEKKVLMSNSLSGTILIFADANPGSATKSKVKSFFNETDPSDSVIPAALEETKSGHSSSTNALASLPQYVFSNLISP